MLALLLYGRHVVAVPLNSEMQLDSKPVTDYHVYRYESAQIGRRPPGSFDYLNIDGGFGDELL